MKITSVIGKCEVLYKRHLQYTQYCQVEFNLCCSAFSTTYRSPLPKYIANVFLQQTNQWKNPFQQGEAHFYGYGTSI